MGAKIADFYLGAGSFLLDLVVQLLLTWPAWVAGGIATTVFVAIAINRRIQANREDCASG